MEFTAIHEFDLVIVIVVADLSFTAIVYRLNVLNKQLDTVTSLHVEQSIKLAKPVFFKQVDYEQLRR